MAHPRLVLLVLATSLAPMAAYAQFGGPSPSPTTTARATTSAPTAPQQPTPATSASARPATGYGYGSGPKSTPPPLRRAIRQAPRAHGPEALLAGFRPAGSGGSRFFVHMSVPMMIEPQKSPGRVSFLLKGAAIYLWNNSNPLITTHFNTPVRRARLIQRGRDVLFELELRTYAEPMWSVERVGNAATLVVDFPKGDFLPRFEP